jgi:hypothetical protein
VTVVTDDIRPSRVPSWTDGGEARAEEKRHLFREQGARPYGHLAQRAAWGAAAALGFTRGLHAAHAVAAAAVVDGFAAEQQRSLIVQGSQVAQARRAKRERLTELSIDIHSELWPGWTAEHDTGVVPLPVGEVGAAELLMCRHSGRVGQADAEAAILAELDAEASRRATNARQLRNERGAARG